METSGEQIQAFDLGVTWNPGSPRPVLLQSDTVTILLFYLPDGINWSEPSPDADLGGEELAVVTFHGCSRVTFGHPNEEVLHGHRLWPKGLRYNGAHEVLNSAWIAELEQVNAVHPRHDPRRWRKLRHFILTFQDSTFECVAEGFEVSVSSRPLEALVSELARRLY